MDRSELLVSSRSDGLCNEANETCSFYLVGHFLTDIYIFLFIKAEMRIGKKKVEP